MSDAIGGKIVVFFFTGGVAAYSIWNSITYKTLMDNGGGAGVSKSAATAGFWTSVVLAIIFLLLFIWSIWRLLTTEKQRGVAGDRVANIRKQAANRAAFALNSQVGLLPSSYLTNP